MILGYFSDNPSFLPKARFEGTKRSVKTAINLRINGCRALSPIQSAAPGKIMGVEHRKIKILAMIACIVFNCLEVQLPYN